MYTDRKSGFAVQIRLRILIFGLCGRNGEFMHKTEQEGLKYQKLYNWAHTLITSGVIKNMDKFPSETSLQKKFGYSRQTVRTALRQLEEEGLITRVRGSGTYVSYDSSGANGERPQIGLLSHGSSISSKFLIPSSRQTICATFHAQSPVK